MFGSLGFPELLIVLVIVIIIFGANRLPQLGQGVGSAIRNFKKGMGDPGDTGDAGDTAERPTSARTASCANCGTVNPAGSRFCSKCGGKL